MLFKCALAILTISATALVLIAMGHVTVGVSLAVLAILADIYIAVMSDDSTGE